VRPEDVELGPETQRYIAEQNLDPDAVREACATAAVAWRDQEDPPSDGDWLVVLGMLPDGRRLRMTCGPTVGHVASARIVPE
jgi:hypothetical protein